ncbi:MAG: hypothetical protein HUJ29_11810 [Gammaproteobacteria bacterium]|nr:hypothetical protein [Gammaproteobacteria bacterium]
MKKIFLLGFLLLLGACGKQETNTMVLFAEAEQGIEPYMTRTIVTPDYMRIDYNQDDDDFILFDRKTGIIYSVVHENETIVSVKPSKVDAESPMELDFNIEKGVLGEDVPDIDGETPAYYRYTANGEVCFETISVEGILPDVATVYREYLKSLSGEHARILPTVPAGMQNACDLATNIFAYGRQYEKGFPINEWHGEYNNHYKRQMIEYKTNIEVEPELFKLPESYHQYSPAEIAPVQ